MRFKGQTAVITGAASGMGLLCAQKITEEYGNVVMTDINTDALLRSAADINAHDKGKAIAVPCDVRKYEEVAEVCSKAVDTFGHIDLLVTAAGGAELRILGIPSNNDFAETPIEAFNWSIDVNLKGQFYFAHAAMKSMKEQKNGAIILFGSISAEVGCMYNVGYSAAKSGAVNGLLKSLARYGAPYNIRCCAVTPGPVLTRPGMAALKTPLGRAADPSEIVELILFLASDTGKNMTGINIVSDGGYTIVN